MKKQSIASIVREINAATYAANMSRRDFENFTFQRYMQFVHAFTAWLAPKDAKYWQQKGYAEFTLYKSTEQAKKEYLQTSLKRNPETGLYMSVHAAKIAVLHEYIQRSNMTDKKISLQVVQTENFTDKIIITYAPEKYSNHTRHAATKTKEMKDFE